MELEVAVFDKESKAKKLEYAELEKRINNVLSSPPMEHHAALVASYARQNKAGVLVLNSGLTLEEIKVIHKNLSPTPYAYKSKVMQRTIQN